MRKIDPRSRIYIDMRLIRLDKVWLPRCTEASLIGPERPHFDPDTNPVNPTTTPMFATNPDERCQRMLKDVARC
jgi:hypothetical protein